MCVCVCVCVHIFMHTNLYIHIITLYFQFRGAVFFLLAVMGILLFDHDDLEHHKNDQYILYVYYPTVCVCVYVF